MIFQESETVELKSIVVDDIKKEIIAIETSDNAFKIILPNLNVHTEQDEPSTGKLFRSVQEDFVIDLAKKQGTFTRKDLEKTLEISQTTCGRLLKRMVENGQIVQEGKGRNTHYRLSE